MRAYVETRVRPRKGGEVCGCSRRVQRANVDPVRLPGLAVVVGERLLELERGRRDVREHEAHEDRAAVVGFLIVELAATVTESADRRHAERAARAVRELGLPLMRLGVVHAKAEGGCNERGAQLTLAEDLR